MATIRPATAADIGRLALTATRAFANDPVMRWLLPDDHEYREVNPRMVAYMCRRWQANGTQWCTDDCVALAGWVPPGRPDVDVEPLTIDHPQERLAKFDALRAAFGEHTPSEPHWYLNMLATHPDWQRQGCGAALMSHVFGVADEHGLACYLETETPENVAYYRHNGFEVRSEWDLATHAGPGPHMWGMLRPPR